MADLVAKVIRGEVEAARRCVAAPPRPAFVYRDKGSMATIGRGRAVAEIGSLHMRGLLAWLAWLFVHLVLLVGVRNRIFVLLSWAISYITFTKGTRIIAGNPPSHLRTPVGTIAADDATPGGSAAPDSGGRRPLSD